jgi:phage N-6-adenine-methyltransferase
MITNGLMSSLTDEWATPQKLFDELHAEFHFETDVCANESNTKCRVFFTKEQNGLLQDWTGVCWMNPPYGRQIGEWMQKAYASAESGRATVVCLVPARTDTRWWHDYAMKGEFRLIRGRVKFVDSQGGGEKPAPFPSAIVIFRAKNV